MPIPHELEVRLDRKRIKVFTIGGMKEGAAPASWGGTLYGSPEWEKYALQVHDELEVRLPVKAGRHEVGIAFVRKSWEAEDVLQPRQSGWPLSSDEMFDSNPGVDTVIVEGPYDPAGPGDTPSRRRIFTCQPASASDATARQARGDETCAKTILSTIARRAYRRPLADRDVQTLMEFYAARRSQRRLRGRRSAGARAHPRQPRFPVPHRAGAGDGAGQPPSTVSTDLELATRLSFFLWSSIPDDELLGGGRAREA